MSIVTKDEILKEIEVGNIEITPFRRDQAGRATIDLHFGNELGISKTTYQAFPLINKRLLEKRCQRKIVKDGNHFLLLPRETGIVATKKKIKLSPTFSN